MIFRILLFAFLAFVIAGCNKNPEKHDHEEPAEEHGAHSGEHHGEGGDKIQFTAYNSDYELFAEADVFIVGKSSNILSHFSKIPSFKALESGKVTVTLTIEGVVTKQTLEKPTRKGIYSFDIIPERVGKGTLTFLIDTSLISISDVSVFDDHDQAHKHAESQETSKVNTVVFTKEQSWKIEFGTELPKKEAFGQVIRTVAKIEPASGDESVISAKTSGIIVFSSQNLLQGNNVSTGQKLFAVSSSGMSENNISVKLSEAQSNFESAQADYLRHKELARDKIISEKEVQTAKNLYENTKAVYENLVNNFSATGQSIISPMNGFVKQIYVSNGQYVQTGTPLITVSQNKTLVLNAFVQQKYIGILSLINSANIKTLYDNKTYDFKELNGKILSYGKSASNDNFLLPVNLQIDNIGSFVQGSFVEIYLKTITNTEALTVPNSAFSEEQGNFFVFVQITPELFEKREIKIGVTDGIRTEILSGLTANERLITKGSTIVKLSQASGSLDAHSGHVH